MKFPGRQRIFLTRNFWFGESEPGAFPAPKPGAEGDSWFEKKNRASAKSVAQLQLFGDRLVTAQILALQIFEQAAALADHHQQTRGANCGLSCWSANARSNG
jgi:hypothetical protein